MTVIKDYINSTQFLTHGNQCFHSAHQHGAITHYADDLFIGVDQFGGIYCGDAVAHGIKV